MIQPMVYACKLLLLLLLLQDTLNKFAEIKEQAYALLLCPYCSPGDTHKPRVSDYIMRVLERYS